MASTAPGKIASALLHNCAVGQSSIGGQWARAHLCKHALAASEQTPNSSLEQTVKAALGQSNESGSLEVFDCTVTQLLKSIFLQLHH
jgi:hypothetical protein